MCRQLMAISLMLTLSGTVLAQAQHTEFGTWTFSREVDVMTDEVRCGVGVLSNLGDDLSLHVTKEEFGLVVFFMSGSSPQVVGAETVIVEVRFDGADLEQQEWLTTGSGIVASSESTAVIARLREAERMALRFVSVSGERITAMFEKLDSGRNDAFAAFGKCVAEASK